MIHSFEQPNLGKSRSEITPNAIESILKQMEEKPVGPDNMPPHSKLWRLVEGLAENKSLVEIGLDSR